MDGIQSETPDDEIIRRILHGNINEFEILLKRYQDAVFGIVTKHIPCGMVEEIAHTVFVKAYSSLSSFSRKKPFKHWLSKIAVKTCYDFWRERYKSQEIIMSSLTEEDNKILETVITHQSTEYFDNEEFLKESRELLNWALDKLPPEDRMVLSMVHLEGLSIKETATLLGWSTMNVKVRSFRARKKLQKYLTKLLEHGEVKRTKGEKI